jgi:hypothetical protein
VVLGPDVPHLFGELFHDPAHGCMGGAGLAPLDGTGHINVQLQRFVVRQMRHEAVLGPAGQNFGHQVLELGKHGVAGSPKHRGMEFNIKPEEFLLVSPLAGGP